MNIKIYKSCFGFIPRPFKHRAIVPTVTAVPGPEALGIFKCVVNHLLQILCLHGYRQNEVLFRDKLGAFRKMVAKAAEFTFVTAPHPVPPLDDPDAENQNQVALKKIQVLRLLIVGNTKGKQLFNSKSKVKQARRHEISPN